jgi:plasmid stability protein
MQARSAYRAGMKQYTLRNVPADVDRALRRTAREQGKSLNQVAIETLGRAVGVAEPRKRRDLSDLVGTWLDDPETAAALEDQRRIDPESWR